MVPCHKGLNQCATCKNVHSLVKIEQDLVSKKRMNVCIKKEKKRKLGILKILQFFRSIPVAFQLSSYGQP